MPLSRGLTGDGFDAKMFDGKVIDGRVLRKSPDTWFEDFGYTHDLRFSAAIIREGK